MHFTAIGTMLSITLGDGSVSMIVDFAGSDQKKKRYTITFTPDGAAGVGVALQEAAAIVKLKHGVDANNKEH